MQQRSEETRQRILSASEKLFAQVGFDAAGVSEICAAAGVSKGAFYHHFPTKLALFQALLDTWLAQLDAQLSDSLATSVDVPAGILSMAGRTGEIFAAASTHAILLLEFWMQAGRHPEVWQAAIAPYRHYLAVFQQIIERGKQEGSFAPGLDARSSSRMVLALVMGLLLQAFFDPSGENWSEVTTKGMRTLIDGMRQKAE